MTSRRIYANAPIAEAVIEIRVSLPEQFAVQDLLVVCEREQDAYPTRENLMTMEGMVTFGEQSGAAARQRHTGYVCSSADSRQVFHVSADGFAFIRLPPYERWEPFSGEARRLWNVFAGNSRPLSANRIGVRFINRLSLTRPAVDLKDYLKVFPEISSDMKNQRLTEYFMQLKIPQDDIDSMAIINQMLHRTDDSENVEILLDIDLFQEVDVTPDEDTIWSILEGMHIRKNEIFESCITDRIREAIS